MSPPEQANIRFRVLDDPKAEDTSIPAFLVSKSRGFLPRMNPLVTLPPEFDALESILQRMPIRTASGEPGLLADCKLGDVVHAELPDLTEHVDKYKNDLVVQTALYRDYCFVASAYLLEPCHGRFMRGEPYGLGRETLPANIARPLVRCAAICQFKPFMEYAASYALFNYRLLDPAAGLEYYNLRLIRAFERGLDVSSSEAGFILVHVAMVKNSGGLVSGTVACLDNCAPGSTTVRNRKKFNDGLVDILGAFTRINGVMETMWNHSKPTDYTSFRTFIFGIKSQSMFPNGVVYEGIGDDKPKSFRGESGADDSMIPMMDNLLQIPMPNNELTEVLKDFRSYRPSDHMDFLAWVAERSQQADLKTWALRWSEEGITTSSAGSEEDDADDLRATRQLWIRILNQVRDFRFRHWCFAREYIIKRTHHPTATGGSPIVTWLPNQLEAVLVEMSKIYEASGGAEALGKECAEIMDLVDRQTETLRKEVSKYCQERGVSK